MTLDESPISLLEPKLGKELVTLIVGPEQHEIAVHKKLLCQSAQYFRSAFEGHFAEAKTGIMTMPEESPEVICLYVEWIYRSKLPDSPNKEYITDLCGLWIFAMQICYDELANTTMDHIQDMCRHYNHFIDFSLLREVYDNTESSSALRYFCSTLKMYELWRQRESHCDGRIRLARREEFREGFEDLEGMRESEDFYANFAFGLQFYTQYHIDSNIDPRVRDGVRGKGACHYHVLSRVDGHEEECAQHGTIA